MFEVRYDYFALGKDNEAVEESCSEFFEYDDGESATNLADELDDDPTVFCVEVLENGVQTYINLKDKNRAGGYVMRGVHKCY